MGCGGSKAQDIIRLTEQQALAMKKQEQIALQQQQQIKLQAEALENARQQQAITAKQFEEQKALLLQQQAQLVKQQQEALQMALLAKQQTELVANSAAESALKKAEALRRRLTPPAKPGKVNVLVQTDRTIPPNAIMKRRHKKEDSGGPSKDHREECGGVGTEAVEAPDIAQVPVLVAREKPRRDSRRSSSAKSGDRHVSKERKASDEGPKNKQKTVTKSDVDDEDDEYEYQYEYQYQYQYQYDIPAGPKAIVKPTVTAVPDGKLIAGVLEPRVQEIINTNVPIVQSPKASLVEQTHQPTIVGPGTVTERRKSSLKSRSRASSRESNSRHYEQPPASEVGASVYPPAPPPPPKQRPQSEPQGDEYSDEYEYEYDEN